MSSQYSPWSNLFTDVKTLEGRVFFFLVIQSRGTEPSWVGLVLAKNAPKKPMYPPAGEIDQEGSIWRKLNYIRYSVCLNSNLPRL